MKPLDARLEQAMMRVTGKAAAAAAHTMAPGDRSDRVAVESMRREEPAPPPLAGRVVL